MPIIPQRIDNSNKRKLVIKHIIYFSHGRKGLTTHEIVARIVEKYKLNPRDPWNSFCNFLKREGENEHFDILSPNLSQMSQDWNL